MRKTLIYSFLIASMGWAQQTVAPTTEPVGSQRGDTIGGYNILNSFELGYRFDHVGGNPLMYRSNVNFGNGLRLLSSSLNVHSREGHGGLFDEIVLNTQGLGNDPYEAASLRIEKNRLYRYDMLWRLDEYFNPALTISFGEHIVNTRRQVQDHDLILLPQSKVRLLLGYTRNSQTGPALSTVQEFGSRGDEFPFLAGVRRQRNEYRLGGDVTFLGGKLTLLRGWDGFKEDTPYRLFAPSPGNNPDDRTAASQFNRTEPYHGTSPYWRVGLNKQHRIWSVTARYNYTGGRRNFLLDEFFGGTALGLARSRQILVAGDARRPVSNGNLTLSFFPGSKITITNHTAFHNTRMDGDSFYRELNNATLTSDLFYFQLLGIRTIGNQTDVNYRVSESLGFFTGYHFSTRHIRSQELLRFPDATADNTVAQQENTLHSGLFGIRLRPVKPLSINLDAEVARADRPFYPISERNYHTLGGSLRYKLKSVTLTAQARSNYNTNSVSLSSFSSRARNYSLNGSWAPRDWFSLDAGYSKVHLDTAGGIVYFANSTQLSRTSIYISNIHAGNIAARFGILKRADLYLGYSRVQDLGDGRSALPADPFLAAQTFPLAFESPLVRLSVRLHNRIRWNAGYQYYRYGEKFFSLQNYRANTGYTSVLWSF